MKLELLASMNVLALGILIRFLVLLIAYLGRTPLILAVILMSPLLGLANKVWYAHRFVIFAILLAALVFAVNGLASTGSRPPDGLAEMVYGKPWVLWLSAGLWLVLGIALAWHPELFGNAGVVLSVATQFWVALGTGALLLCGLVWRRCRWCVVPLAIAFLWVLASFFVHAFEARPMREAKGRVLQRPTLAAQASGWLESRRAAIEASTNYPVIVVAAAGGGIRAAYWTAGILGSLADKPDHFLDHLFGISSVSGASVGAAMFAALVKFKDLHPAMHTRALLGGDFLAPVMGTMLIRDPVSVALR
jgi:hypothetical protein